MSEWPEVCGCTSEWPEVWGCMSEWPEVWSDQMDICRSVNTFRVNLAVCELALFCCKIEYECPKGTEDEAEACH